VLPTAAAEVFSTSRLDHFMETAPCSPSPLRRRQFQGL
jgi:hypothetical protein